MAQTATSAQTATPPQAAKPPATQGTTGTAAKPPAKPAAAAGASALTLKDQKDKVSYALGMNIGHTLKGQSLDINQAAFIQGLKDVMASGKTLMTDDEMGAVLTQLQTEMNAKMIEKIKAEGDAFQAANKVKDGVITLPSGLQYKILTAGTGPIPTATDTVVCNYRGTLVNGMEFDSSFKRGRPATFPVGGVIKGWTEALQLMPVGSKWQLVIPPDLAYSNHPPPNSGIAPYSTLVFEVELVSIQGK
jgi:FKBP-type peptidyl-prolyl cis-trans isomerase FklB